MIVGEKDSVASVAKRYRKAYYRQRGWSQTFLYFYTSNHLASLHATLKLFDKNRAVPIHPSIHPSIHPYEKHKYKFRNQDQSKNDTLVLSTHFLSLEFLLLLRIRTYFRIRPPSQPHLQPCCYKKHQNTLHIQQPQPKPIAAKP